MKYQEILTNSFLNDVKAIKKDRVLLDRLHKKMNEIVQNPGHYPLKKYSLKNKRSAHVGSFVVLFKIDNDKLIYLKFRHHDFVYK